MSCTSTVVSTTIRVPVGRRALNATTPTPVTNIASVDSMNGAPRIAPTPTPCDDSDPPPVRIAMIGIIVTQVLAALALIVIGAQVFVGAVEHLSSTIGLDPRILALVIAPIATELPEKFNSVIWVRSGKDTLAMGNISGAMVFQSTIPVSIGLLFTPWHLTTTPLVAAAIALASGGLAYIEVRRSGTLQATHLLRAGVLWIAFVTFVVAKIAFDF